MSPDDDSGAWSQDDYFIFAEIDSANDGFPWMFTESFVSLWHFQNRGVIGMLLFNISIVLFFSFCFAKDGTIGDKEV